MGSPKKVSSSMAFLALVASVAGVMATPQSALGEPTIPKVTSASLAVSKNANGDINGAIASLSFSPETPVFMTMEVEVVDGVVRRCGPTPARHSRSNGNFPVKAIGAVPAVGINVGRHGAQGSTYLLNQVPSGYVDRRGDENAIITVDDMFRALCKKLTPEMLQDEQLRKDGFVYSIGEATYIAVPLSVPLITFLHIGDDGAPKFDPNKDCFRLIKSQGRVETEKGEANFDGGCPWKSDRAVEVMTKIWEQVMAIEGFKEKLGAIKGSNWKSRNAAKTSGMQSQAPDDLRPSRMKNDTVAGAATSPTPTVSEEKF